MHYFKGGGTWEVDNATGGVQACRGDVGKEYMRVLLDALCDGRPDAGKRIGATAAAASAAAAAAAAPASNQVSSLKLKQSNSSAARKGKYAQAPTQPKESAW